MKNRSMAILLISGFLGVAYVAVPNCLRGQAAPGPIHPPQSSPEMQAPAQPQAQQPPPQKLTLFGSWRFNADQSDDARKKMQEARGANGGGQNGPYGGGGGGRMGGGFPFPGGGGGGWGHRRGSMGRGQSDENRQEMQELINPAESLTLAQKSTAEVDLTDDQGRKRVFYTDGRKLQKSKDDKYQELAAHWDGSRLVSEEKGTRGRTITRTFEIAPNGQQLYETVELNNSRSSSPVVIRYVYDPSPENSAAAPANR
jgi:hypothetical protein